MTITMMRVEFVLVGCILVVLGVIISSIGYDKLQPTALENVVTFVEQVSGRNAPDSLHSSKTGGYLFLLFGGASVVAGLGMILSSRTAHADRRDAEAGRLGNAQAPNVDSKEHDPTKD